MSKINVNSSKIAILLATYNGEEYIREQIDSLLNQSFQDFVIYIHDDGSTDTTLTIVEKYISIYPDKIILLLDSSQHRGARDSFLWLLQHVESSYYMFCDQDDVWLPTKIEETFKRIVNIEKQQGKERPVLIHTDLMVVDKKLTLLHESLWEYQKYKVDISKHYDFILQGNVVTGCTVIINHAVKNVAFPVYRDIAMHDWWLAIVSAKYGIVENLKQKTILYRQHEKNVCGSHYERYSLLYHIKNLSKIVRARKDLLIFLDYNRCKFCVLKICFFIFKALYR